MSCMFLVNMMMFKIAPVRSTDVAWSYSAPRDMEYETNHFVSQARSHTRILCRSKLLGMLTVDDVPVEHF